MRKITLMIVMIAGIGMTSCKKEKTEETTVTEVDTTVVTDSVPPVVDTMATSTDTVVKTTETTETKKTTE